MKLVAIGDLHGRDVWKQIVEREAPDMTVFLGDYLDSFDIPAVVQLHNLKEIIAYKKAYPDKVILLLGNHDWHYLRCATQSGEYYSGFQPSHMFAYQILLEENLNLFRACYLQGNFLFSHAGVGTTWLEKCGYTYSSEGNVVYRIEEFVNDLFRFQPLRFALEWGSPSGDSPNNSPFWIRPKSLMSGNKKTDLHRDLIQVVGHTFQNQIDVHGKATGGRYYFIDTLGTSGEYLIIQDGNFSTGNINI